MRQHSARGFNRRNLLASDTLSQVNGGEEAEIVAHPSTTSSTTIPRSQTGLRSGRINAITRAAG
jgi:hypothetical protein